MIDQQNVTKQIWNKRLKKKTQTKLTKVTEGVNEERYNTFGRNETDASKSMFLSKSNKASFMAAQGMKVTRIFLGAERLLTLNAVCVAFSRLITFHFHRFVFVRIEKQFEIFAWHTDTELLK